MTDAYALGPLPASLKLVAFEGSVPEATGTPARVSLIWKSSLDGKVWAAGLPYYTFRELTITSSTYLTWLSTSTPYQPDRIGLVLSATEVNVGLTDSHTRELLSAPNPIMGNPGLVLFVLSNSEISSVCNTLKKYIIERANKAVADTDFAEVRRCSWWLWRAADSEEDLVMSSRLMTLAEAENGAAK